MPYQQPSPHPQSPAPAVPHLLFFKKLFGLGMMFPRLRDNEKKVENNWESTNHLKLELLYFKRLSTVYSVKL